MDFPGACHLAASMVGRYAASSKTKEMTMNKKLLIAALFAVLLAGCAHHDRRGGDKEVNATTPQVSVVDGRVVAPAALVYLRGQPAVTITWQLPRDAKVRFAENGIVIEGRLLNEVLRGDKPSVVLDPRQNDIVDCKRGREGLEFSCLNKHTQPGIFKYTIRLIDESQKQLVLDPAVVNM